jgi:hypothetical protein
MQRLPADVVHDPVIGNDYRKTLMKEPGVNNAAGFAQSP